MKGKCSLLELTFLLRMGAVVAVLTFLWLVAHASSALSEEPRRRLRLYFKPSPKNPLPLPEVGEVATWEAERAKRIGDWEFCQDEGASGGIYLRPLGEGEERELEFFFETKKPVNLRVWPLLFRHSDRRPARCFPYPLEHRAGPDVVDWLDVSGKRLVFFTSPEAGVVACLDPDSLKVIKAHRLGGFLSDLLVERALGKVVVADAAGDKVYFLDPGDMSVQKVVEVHGAPWSLAVHEGVVYVACLKGRLVVALDLLSGKKLAEASLPFEPAHLEVTGEGNPPRTKVVVWPLPILFDLETMQQVRSHREILPFGRRRYTEVGPRHKPGWRRVYPVGEGVLRVETLTEKGWQRKELDVRSVTGEPKKAGLKPPLPDTVGPDILTIVAGKVFFTSPLRGRVGVVDLVEMEVLGSIEIGGILSDMVEGPGNTVLVAEVTGRRVVLVDAEALKVTREIKVPGMPVSLDVYLPPEYVKNAPTMCFAVLWDKRMVVRLDVGAGKVDWEGSLPSEPWMMLPVKPPNPGWWPLISSDRLHLEGWRNYLGVLLAPRAFEPGRLKDLGPDTTVGPEWRRRTEVAFDLGGGLERVVRVDNHHTLEVVLREVKEKKVLERKWLDVSQWTDWQLLPSPRPLSRYDCPGPVTISVNKGPEFPWRGEIWQTPDQLQFLLAESEEFWRWNAPVFSFPLGRHVIRLRAYSPFVQVDALKVEKALKGWVDIKVLAQPPNSEALPAERYRAFFYHKEPVIFELKLKNNLNWAQEVGLSFVVQNYMGEEVKRGQKRVKLEPLSEASLSLRFDDLEDTGTFTLLIAALSEMGQSVKVYRFVRLPQLTRPRMLFRPEEIPRIRERIVQHRRLFENFFSWLRRHCDKPGFLPAGVTKEVFVPKLPEEQRKRKMYGAGGVRRWDLGWRMLCLQFAAMFDPNEERRLYFQRRVREILQPGTADYYITYHYHGPFFPGAVAALMDLVASVPGQAPEEVRKLRSFFYRHLGDMNVDPWTLAALEEPLTPRERAILWHMGMWLMNVERYFEAHQGKRGGKRWLNLRTGCYCPYLGYAYIFLWLKNFLREPRFHEKKIIWGFINHSSLARAIYDKRKICGLESHRNPPPLGEPIKWIDNMLARHPLEKWRYMEEFGFRKIVERLSAEEVTPREVDKLLYYPPQASTHNPVPYVVPLGLALGWFDPEAPEVRQEELPPTMLFDVEGDVIMRSGWGPEDTEVFFTCGVRDHVYRHQPTHLRIGRAGEYLLGEASSIADHGYPGVGKSWGNIVVIEPSRWLKRWGENFWHPRAEEYCIMNRFSDPTFRYIVRDRRLVGYSSAEEGWGGGIVTHGHTQSLFVKEGEILAFETWPEFDYVAGDATNSWPLGLAEEVYRQVVFVKPDVVVVYDRVKLGPKAQKAFWLAATGPELKAAGNEFLVRSGKCSMKGKVLLPERSIMSTFDPTEQNKYTIPPPFSEEWFLFDGNTRHQKVLEIHPLSPSRKVEFLVVMKVGKRGTEEPELELKGLRSILDKPYAGAEFEHQDRRIRVRFRREGPVGGDIVMTGRGRRISHEFVRKIDDSYRRWKTDPRFRKWVTEPRFRYFIPEED